ncbi:hypothetical protein Esti_003506 [Eimeria stiedai]
MPATRTAAGDLSPRSEEFLPSQPPSSPLHLSACAKGGEFLRTDNWGPQKGYCRCFSAMGTMLAAAALVFFIYYCRVRIVNSMGSNIVKRRLGGAGQGGDQGAKEQSYEQVCGGIGEKVGQVEGTTTTGSPHHSPAPVVLNAEGLAEGERPRKRMRYQRPGKGHGSLAKAASLSEDVAVLKTTSVPSDKSDWFVSQPSRADFRGSGLRGLQQLDFSEGSGSRQGGFEESNSSADGEARSGEGDFGVISKQVAHFTLKEAVVADKDLTLDSSSLDMDESHQPSSPPPSDELIPDFLGHLELYMTEVLEAEEGALLDPWILDPEAPMPPSPVETSADEAHNESSKGSAGLYSSLGLLVTSPKSLLREQKPSSESPFPDDSWGKSSHDLHKAETTSERVSQKVQASISVPLPSPPFPQSSVAEALSGGLDAAAPQEDHGGEAAGSPTLDAFAGAGQTPLGSPPLGEPDYANHPFYHTPTVPSSVLEKLGRTRHKHLVGGERLWGLINLARHLLAKPCLSLPDAELLHSCVEALRSHAMSRLTKPLTPYGGSRHFAFAASLRFLIVDILWCASEVLSRSTETKRWFGSLVESMLSTSAPWSAGNLRQRQEAGRLELLSRIFSVWDIYKAGQRPSPKDVVEIKQMIFCGKSVLPAFNQSVWDSWREADRRFRAGFRHSDALEEAT